jgi:hypothetical protein
MNIDNTSALKDNRNATMLWCLALATLLLHFLTNGRYGYFRDEFYYIACGEHLDFGYVDHPPLIAVIARITRGLLGDSLFAIRFFPAVAGALTVLLTGWMARELGGGRFAQVLAALAVMIAPVYLVIDNFLSMNAFEPLFWMLCAYIIILILKRENPKLWLRFGLVAGIGLMNKHSMLFFGFGLFIGLLLTPNRKFFFNKWTWLGILLAFAIFLPNLLWQIKHDWPTLEFMRNASLLKNYPISPVEFLSGQVLLMHPLTVPIWLAGLYFYLVAQEGKPYRVLGWIYVALLALFVVTQAKGYYLAPVYPMLLASGALVVERFSERRHWNWLKPVTIVLLILGGIVTAPFGLPVLPVETFPKYARILGLQEVKMERGRTGKLPQHYADMFGWENMVATVAKVYNNLSPEERAKCAIFTHNYGEAGAIDFFGKEYQLPKAVSGHNNYYLWGPRNYSGEIVITVGESLPDVRKTFDQVEPAAVITHEYARPEEDHLPVYICRNPKMALKEAWRQTKHYI